MHTTQSFLFAQQAAAFCATYFIGALFRCLCAHSLSPAHHQICAWGRRTPTRRQRASGEPELPSSRRLSHPLLPCNPHVCVHACPPPPFVSSDLPFKGPPPSPGVVFASTQRRVPPLRLPLTKQPLFSLFAHRSCLFRPYNTVLLVLPLQHSTWLICGRHIHRPRRLVLVSGFFRSVYSPLLGMADGWLTAVVDLLI